ncbi:MAG: Wzz/FepE/Etk N-terminal domain-containing protein [Solimonas sp.]
MNTPRKLPVLSIATPTGQEPPLVTGGGSELGLSLAQITAIVWAHRKVSIIIASILLVLASVVIKLLPKTFESTATVIVNYEVNDPLSGQAFPIMLMDNYIATQIQLMQSAPVLGPVVEKLQLTKDPDLTAGYQGQGPIEDWVRTALQKKLTITHRAGTQLIYVTAESKQANAAAKLANTVADVYISQQQERLNDPAMAQAKRYTEQLAELKQKVDAAQERISAFRQSTGLTEVTAGVNDTDAYVLNGLEGRYQEALNALRTAETNQANEADVNKAATTSNLVQNLRTQLATQQAQMAEYQTTYGPKHPKVMELASQIAATQESLNNELKNINKSTSADINAARELVAKLKAAVDAQRAKVMSTKEKQDEGAKLALELESARAVYKQALDGYDKVMAAAGGRYSNVSLMNAAEIPIKSTKPNKVKLLMVAFMASLMCGVGAPFMYELLMQRRIRCRDDLERDLGLPVLAEFDAIAAFAREAK